MFTDNVRDYMRRRKAATYMLCESISEYVEKTAKRQARWTDRTAHARQSINHDTQMAGDDIIMTVAHGVKYGKYLEEGTPPHEIRLKNKKAFMWNGLPHPIKKNPIHHPGTKPYNTLKLAAIRGKERLKNSLDRLWR